MYFNYEYSKQGLPIIYMKLNRDEGTDRVTKVTHTYLLTKEDNSLTRIEFLKCYSWNFWCGCWRLSSSRWIPPEEWRRWPGSLIFVELEWGTLFTSHSSFSNFLRALTLLPSCYLLKDGNHGSHTNQFGLPAHVTQPLSWGEYSSSLFIYQWMITFSTSWHDKLSLFLQNRDLAQHLHWILHECFLHFGESWRHSWMKSH